MKPANLILTQKKQKQLIISLAAVFGLLWIKVFEVMTVGGLLLITTHRNNPGINPARVPAFLQEVTVTSTPTQSLTITLTATGTENLSETDTPTASPALSQTPSTTPTSTPEASLRSTNTPTAETPSPTEFEGQGSLTPEPTYTLKPFPSITIQFPDTPSVQKLPSITPTPDVVTQSRITAYWLIGLVILVWVLLGLWFIYIIRLRR